MATQHPSTLMRLMTGSARLAAATWPVAGRVFRERLEIDDNRALWIAKMPGYRPRPPLQGAITADLAIIGGGFTGTSTAYYISRRFPNRRIVLLSLTPAGRRLAQRADGLVADAEERFFSVLRPRERSGFDQTIQRLRHAAQPHDPAQDPAQDQPV